MFTLEKIKAAHQKTKTGADFPQYIADIKEMGVTRYDVYVMNGMTIYFGDDDYTVESPPAYENLLIEEESSATDLKEALKIHQQGETDYQTFCKQAAFAGVEKWITDLNAMTVTYLDMAGHELVVEDIPTVN